MVTINGNPWFLGLDICHALGIATPHMAYARLDHDEKTNRSRAAVGLGFGRDVVLISESGLWRLINRSDKPVAKKLQDWVCKDVLPAIRKDGMYIMGEEKVATTTTTTNHTETTTTTLPIIHVKDGKVYANSRDVADLFRKDHCHVLRDIEALIETKIGCIGPLGWFLPTTTQVKVGFGYRTDPAFDMTRDGLALLVMGYTGAKAMGFKVAYIQRFNEMEATLRNAQQPPVLALPQTYREALLALVASEEVKERQALELAQQSAKITRTQH